MCRIINGFFYFIVFFILWILLDLRLTIFKNHCNLISFILYPEENLLSWLVYLFRLVVLLFLLVLRMLDEIHVVIVCAGFLGSLIPLSAVDFLAESSARCENLESLTLMILFFLLIVFLFSGILNFINVTWDFMKVLILIFIVFYHLLSDYYLVLVYSLGIWCWELAITFYRYFSI